MWMRNLSNGVQGGYRIASVASLQGANSPPNSLTQAMDGIYLSRFARFL